MIHQDKPTPLSFDDLTVGVFNIERLGTCIRRVPLVRKRSVAVAESVPDAMRRIGLRVALDHLDNHHRSGR